MKKLSKRLIYYISILLALFLLISVLALYIRPDTWIIPSAAALLFPFLLFVNLALLVAFIYYKQKYFFVPLAAILLSYPALNTSFAFNILGDKTDKEVKIMSYNVRLFNLYNWIDDVNAGNEILALIKREQPDILCMQEFYSHPEKRNYLKQIMEIGDYRQYYCPGFREGKSYGSIVFSKYPIKDYGTLSDDNSDNVFVYADIELYEQTIRVYSLHLASLYLSREDYHFIDNPGENGKDKPLEAFSGILEKMRYAYNKRLSEVEAVSRHAGACEYPVILCGDFNDVPVSYAYRHFQKQYKDAHKEAGFGLGNTYIRRFVRFRIDYIFLSNSFNVLDFKVIREAYSDHYPVQMVLGF